MGEWTDVTWASADGLSLHARDYAAVRPSARLPVVCLHGLTRNARDFEAIAPRIAAAGRRVIAADMRGRGLSDRDPAVDYRFSAYVADVIAMAKALKIDRAVFIGTSMGGLITLELATQAPSLVGPAIINDIGPEIAVAGLARIASYVGKTPEFADWDEAAGYVRAQNDHALAHYAPADWLAMAKRLYAERGGRIVADYDPAIADRFSDEPPQIDPWERWTTLVADRPVLVLRGGISDLLDPTVADRMVAAGPDVRLRIVPDVGHAPMLDEPEAEAAIDAFLDEVP